MDGNDVQKDRDFIEQAVAACDLSALRAALFHATGDDRLAVGPVAQLDADAVARLRSVCVEILDGGVDELSLRDLDDAALRSIMDMTCGMPCDDTDFAIRKEVLAFRDFPFFHEWEPTKNPVPDDFRVAVIGAGFNGIGLGVQLGRLGIAYNVYERRAEVGGTWSINRYPDIRVDTLSSTYEFSFEKRYPWTEYFARGPEVRSYLDHIADTYGVRQNLRLSHDLVEARFDETTDRWTLRFATPDGEVTADANVVVTASGLFANPNIPDFPGADQFTGIFVHPSRWPDGLSLEGKRVGVIGNGSTGVQLLAPVAAEAAHVTVFQRTPQWISPRDRYGLPVEPGVRWIIDTVPGYWNWCRFTSIMSLFTFHQDFLLTDEEFEASGGRISAKSEFIRSMLTDYIKAEIGDRPDLFEKLLPDYAPMVRRPVVDNGWYRALTRPNVELVASAVESMDASGVITAEGEHYDIDVLICATGFDVVKYLAPAEYIGRGGRRLHDRWADESPRAYAGLMVPEFPNFFMLYGPNSQPVSGGVSLPTWYQMWSAFISRCITTMIDEGTTRVEVTEEAFTEYNERLDREAQKLTMLTDSSSTDNYYVQGGRLQTSAPWETADYVAYTTEPIREHIAFS